MCTGRLLGLQHTSMGCGVQVIMQIPAIYTLLFYLQTTQQTSVVFYGSQPQRLGGYSFYIYFTAYALGAIFWQVWPSPWSLQQRCILQEAHSKLFRVAGVPRLPALLHKCNT